MGRAALGRERAPELVVAREGAQGVDEGGVEPGAAALLSHGPGRRGAVGGAVDLDGLGEAEDAREQRGGVTLEPARIPTAVPMLVEAADGLGRGGRKPETKGDVGSALAAQLGELS